MNIPYEIYQRILEVLKEAKYICVEGDISEMSYCFHNIENLLIQLEQIEKLCKGINNNEVMQDINNM